ncbi:DUF6153 family protein [Nocardia puris]|uniref:Uncharacterized protein n=1 Tax=Nocardia puris TaxID=208602 RepID=A0A366DRS6_9NOCA|nr:DUF6153 family protein [Nocardia puris]RBO92783.1 hypothetical protein DFR74_103429 [Nocardia puris]
MDLEPAPQRASGLLRLLGLLALITGILAMHTGLVTGHGSADATRAGHHQPGAGDLTAARSSAAFPADPHHALLDSRQAATGSATSFPAEPAAGAASLTYLPDDVAAGDRPHDPTTLTHDPIAATWAEALTVPADASLTHAHHITDPPVSEPGSASAPTAFSPAPGCADCDDNHAGLHACVFILTMLALAVALVVLYRLAVDRPGGGVTRPRHWRPRRERSPPWTVLSLAELSILRI